MLPAPANLTSAVLSFTLVPLHRADLIALQTDTVHWTGVGVLKPPGLKKSSLSLLSGLNA